MKYRYSKAGLRSEDRYYHDHEFYRCAVKFRHETYHTAIQHAISMQKVLPLARIRIYECPWCGGLHLSSGTQYRNLTAMTRSYDALKAKMSHPDYTAKAPPHIQARQKIILEQLRMRIEELEERNAEV